VLAATATLAVASIAPAVGSGGNDPEATAHWAHVLRPVTARSAPRLTAPALTRVRSATPEDETNLVLVLETTTDASHRGWARVRLAILPNSATGWVPQDALGATHAVRTRLVVDRGRLRAVLWRGGRVIFRAPVGVGESRWPTPRGEFYVREKLTSFGDPFYGPVAFGTSARSRVLTDWPGGGFVGIHGTDRPELIPGRISHGCIRMRNADILRLARLMPLGTPLTVV
jgi:lipoprotein-anchoring transpeptidase ErfK/SrfK